MIRLGVEVDAHLCIRPCTSLEKLQVQLWQEKQLRCAFTQPPVSHKTGPCGPVVQDHAFRIDVMGAKAIFFAEFF